MSKIQGVGQRGGGAATFSEGRRRRKAAGIVVGGGELFLERLLLARTWVAGLGGLQISFRTQLERFSTISLDSLQYSDKTITKNLFSRLFGFSVWTTSDAGTVAIRVGCRSAVALGIFQGALQ